MIIGLTYDLRDVYLARGHSMEETAELDKLETIEWIEQTLIELGHQTARIGTARELAEALARGSRWDLVFNIAEGLRGVGRESLVPAILDDYDIPYTFSDPMVLALSLHKGMCKRALRDMGVRTPEFLVIEPGAALPEVTLRYPLFVKPVAEGTGKGISGASVVANRAALSERCDELSRRFGQPLLIEEFLPGREVTVGIVGTGDRAHALGAMEVGFRDGGEQVYSMVNKEDYLERVDYTLVEPGPFSSEIEAISLAVWRGLGCRDGGRVDLRCDAQGRPSFIEVNPLAGLNAVHSDLPIINRLAGRQFIELIADIIESASERVDHVGRQLIELSADLMASASERVDHARCYPS